MSFFIIVNSRRGCRCAANGASPFPLALLRNNEEYLFDKPALVLRKLLIILLRLCAYFEQRKFSVKQF